MNTAQGEFRLTRAEYVALLNQVWSSIKSYRVHIESQKITIAEGKQKATHEATIIENTTATNGETLRVRSHQKSIYEIVDGKIMITSTETREEML